ncbi:MAG: CvpA family protein [Planctomycetia bacterium]|nr:CvpA family protein [Planctomycetia bacterium]MCC7313893.1 CvpA family protein [Planctomycetota bacterium]OQY98581.1 MAG: hypothetical protein B6D36_17385 [Planctomycetes bacterium UTPLA1]
MITMKPPVDATARSKPAGPGPETRLSDALRPPMIRSARPSTKAPFAPVAPVYSSILTIGLGGAMLFMSLQRGLLLGQIAAAALTACTLHGLWRGGFRKLVMLAFAVVMVVFGPSIQAFTSNLVTQTTGSPPGMGGFVLTALGATALWCVCHFGTKSFRRRVIMRRGGLLAVDRVGGAALGLAEGVAIVLSLCWFSTSLQPFAKLMTDEKVSPKGSPRAQVGATMLRLAQESRMGAMASVTDGTNPIAKIPALRDAIHELNTTGQIRPEQIDPKMAEQLRELLKNLPTGNDLNPVLQGAGGGISLEKVLNQAKE